MATLYQRLEEKTQQVNENKLYNAHIAELLNSFQLFQGMDKVSAEKLKNKLPNNREDNPEDEQKLIEKLYSLVEKLPEHTKKTDSIENFREGLEESSGIAGQFTLAYNFFKEVVWDYTSNAFLIIMGSKNPAAYLYDYTKESSRQILTHLKNQKLDQTNPAQYNQINATLRTLNKEVWLMQKEQQVQNIYDIVNFRLAGLIFASSFMLATLSIIAPVIGMEIGFSAILSALYLATGTTIASSACLLLSYLDQADLCIRGSDAYAETMTSIVETTYDWTTFILSPFTYLIKDCLLGYPSEIYECKDEDKNILDEACAPFTKTIGAKV